MLFDEPNEVKKWPFSRFFDLENLYGGSRIFIANKSLGKLLFHLLQIYL